MTSMISRQTGGAYTTGPPCRAVAAIIGATSSGRAHINPRLFGKFAVIGVSTKPGLMRTARAPNGASLCANPSTGQPRPPFVAP
jgi:hypothetical protein